MTPHLETFLQSTFCLDSRIQICDSLNVSLTQGSRKSLQARYKKIVDDYGKIIVSFLSVQKQADTCSCGPFATVYAAQVLDGKSPTEAVFDVQNMRTHLIQCLESQNLVPFPKHKV